MQDIEREEEIRQFEMQQAEAQNEEKEAKRLQELEAKRNAVAEFKMQKRQKQLEMIEAYEQAHRDELAMLAELKPHNVERVKYRSNERVKKLEQKRHEIEERELQRQEIERKLEQLRLSVAITAETDWNRILRPTKSFQVSKETEKLPQLFTVPGFSVASLMKDRRFRISAALHQLGLQNSAYAHDLIMKINKLK
ncbi:hypothetical protein HDU99_000618 [Rhizoclosmatium hyalinum]|nr:hypothetical protein HDU99_000618 [Rhizoclosmatium hyalinum]